MSSAASQSLTSFLSSTATSSTQSPTSSSSNDGDSNANGINSNDEPTDVGSKSLIFGFAFFAILITFLFTSVAYQRWSARRQRALRLALGILDRDEDGYYDGPAGLGGRQMRVKPKFWDAYVDAGMTSFGEDMEEKTWRWRDLKPLAARWVVPSTPSEDKHVQPTTPNPETFRFFPMFSPPRRMNPVTNTIISSRPSKAKVVEAATQPTSDDPNALQVAFLIAMPTPPEFTQKPTSPGEADPLMYYEIGVADAKAERELLS